MAKEKKDKAPLYLVRNSTIHGRGLYARSFIEKDTWIVQYVGEKVDKDESDRRANVLLEEAAKTGGAKVYMFILNDQWDIDGDVEWNDARLMNHSCDPNVEAQTWQEKEIWFIALRDIEAGEELTFNYGFDLEHWSEHPCLCGTKRCVGYIAAEEYWPALKRKVAAKKAAADRKKAAKKAAKKAKKSAKASKTAKSTKAAKSPKPKKSVKTTKPAASKKRKRP